MPYNNAPELAGRLPWWDDKGFGIQLGQGELWGLEGSEIQK